MAEDSKAAAGRIRDINQVVTDAVHNLIKNADNLVISVEKGLKQRQQAGP